MTILLTNACLIDPEAGTDAIGSVLIDKGVIKAINSATPPKGVAVRMACMDLLARNLRAERGRKAVGVMV